MASSLILVSNPGSASRKYALYTDTLNLRARLHIETDERNQLVCTMSTSEDTRQIAIDQGELSSVPEQIEALLRREHILQETDTISGIGLRIVAPGSFFLEDHTMNEEATNRLHDAQDLAPLHVASTLAEFESLRHHFPDVPIIGVSDSAFHITKPPYAWNYGIKLADADRLDIKRFGYHGISTSSVIETLWNKGKLPPKVIVCHLGSGSSITGTFHGRSIDTSMGFTPLEGVLMSTRSGTIDFSAVRALKKGLSMNDEQIEDYLHHESGLKGLGGVDDIRQLIEQEANGDHTAHLALNTLVHTIHKAIGAMLVTLNGADAIIFTGTVGERSAILRKRIVAHLEFADFIIDGEKNGECTTPRELTIISQATKSRPIFVIPTDESHEIAKRTIAKLL